jgi:hypothetical protein
MVRNKPFVLAGVKALGFQQNRAGPPYGVVRGRRYGRLV